MATVKGTVKKLVKTRWRLENKEVKPNTPGAVKVREESRTYYVVWWENDKPKREDTHCTQHKYAMHYLTKWREAREKGHVGLVDPHKKHLDRALTEHVAEYLQSLSERSTDYQKEVRRVLTKIEKLEGVSSLRDLTKDKIENYLASLTAGAVTRALHRSYVRAFFAWLVEKDRIENNPVDKIAVPKRRDRRGEKPRRRRRALSVSELQRLMHAARVYPLASKGRTQGGRPRRDGSPAQPRTAAPKLSPETVEKLQLAGQERELVYRLALCTALRRGELSRVTVGMFDGRKLTVPVSICKYKPEDVEHYLIPLPPTLAAELQSLIAVTGRKSEDKLVYVPLRRNYLREHLKRLEHAKIEYKTEKGHGDIHSFRTTVNVLLQRKGVPLKHCHLLVRHRARDITTQRYDSDAHDEVIVTKTVFRWLCRLDKKVTTPPTTEGSATPS